MKTLAPALGFLIVLSSAQVAVANLIQADPFLQTFSGTGLGSVNTVLTIQDSTSEQGCVGRSTAGCPSGTLSPTPSDPGRIIGGTLGGDESTGDSQTKTIAALGIASGGDIRIVFNANEPSGNGVTIEALVLTIYNADNSIQFTGGLASSVVLASTLTGTGNSGFTFLLDAAQAAAAGLLDPTDRIGLSARISDTAGGAETFFVTSASGNRVPEPATVALLGGGLVGIAAFFRRRRRP